GAEVELGTVEVKGIPIGRHESFETRVIRALSGGAELLLRSHEPRAGRQLHLVRVDEHVFRRATYRDAMVEVEFVVLFELGQRYRRPSARQEPADRLTNGVPRRGGHGLLPLRVRVV